MSLRHYSFYTEQTGELHPVVFSTDDANALKSNTPAGHRAIEGKLDRLSQRVDLTGEKPMVVDYRPPQPSANHEWNAQTRRWQLNAAAQAAEDKRLQVQSSVAQLHAEQHDVVRAVLLGDAAAIGRLRAIDAEIVKLRAKPT